MKQTLQSVNVGATALGMHGNLHLSPLNIGIAIDEVHPAQRIGHGDRNAHDNDAIAQWKLTNDFETGRNRRR